MQDGKSRAKCRYIMSTKQMKQWSGTLNYIFEINIAENQIIKQPCLPSTVNVN